AKTFLQKLSVELFEIQRSIPHQLRSKPEHWTCCSLPIVCFDVDSSRIKFLPKPQFLGNGEHVEVGKSMTPDNKIPVIIYANRSRIEIFAPVLDELCRRRYSLVSIGNEYRMNTLMQFETRYRRMI